MLEFVLLALVAGAYLGLRCRIACLVFASLLWVGLTVAEGMARGLGGWSFASATLALLGLEFGYLVGAFLRFSNLSVRPHVPAWDPASGRPSGLSTEPVGLHPEHL